MSRKRNQRLLCRARTAWPGCTRVSHDQDEQQLRKIESLLTVHYGSGDLDTLSTYRNWLVFGRYAAIAVLRDEDEACADALLRFERWLADWDRPYSQDGCIDCAGERFLVEVGLFTADELQELDEWRWQHGPPQNFRLEEWDRRVKQDFGPTACVMATLPHPWQTGCFEILLDGETLASGERFGDAWNEAHTRRSELDRQRAAAPAVA